MGLLDQLWDDTMAGPRPDSGLGKLRKYSSFSPSSSSSASAAAAAVAEAAAAPGGLQVTRSITILRTASSGASSPRSALDSGSSAPSSPASVPSSPLTPTGPRGEWRRLKKKPTPTAEGMETAQPRNPTVYDWVVISSLDR
ncbi:dormancy-associated protein homolog 3-like [Phoenix dactylifera]|uniref:Dormancy-associated protein homolog 3-like n=1 Tax=Phoenix dactylifera TaxID=42345 RepID=A0A8B9APZ2_PHODC|nr:dormancy-associated protein homolog 3-like [Phoenix dactylifera]